MHETTAFGAALAAGITIGVWDIESYKSIPINFETYNCNILENGKGFKVFRNILFKI